MRKTKLWSFLLGVDGILVEDVTYDEDTTTLVVSARPKAGQRNRCAHCKRRCGKYDNGDGTRRWRGLDLGTIFAAIEAPAPRVRCPEHGVVVAAVPWARHGSWFTIDFEDQISWMATNMSKAAIANLMRIAWRTVGRIIERVVNEKAAKIDRFANLKKIGVDEVSYRKGHRYLTVVVDHESGRLIWAVPGKDEAALDAFFDALGEERTGKIELVSSDAAAWYTAVIRRRCPKARLCLDPFHVVKWATEALDEVRRQVWNDLRRSGQSKLAESLKRSRYALWKNPENLTEKQGAKLAQIAQVNKPLYRAYLLKEQLREVFKLKGVPGIVLLDKWRAWARRSKIPPFVELAKSIANHRAGIVATLAEGLTNARVEAMNTKLRLITRVAFGFHSPEPMIALAMLRLGGLCPPLPGRE